MLAKLSLRGARRQAGDYMVYFITISLAAALIYAFNALVLSPEIGTLSSLLASMVYVVAAVSVVVVGIVGWLVYYTLRFMLAKRSREFATYSLLGVEKRQVATLFVRENLAVGAAALLGGLLVGALLYQALRAVIMWLFGTPYTFSFGFAPGAIGLTLVYFLAIFLFALLRCRRRIRKMTIRDLMDLDRQNEGEIVGQKKSRKKLFIFSLVCGVLGTVLILLRNLLFGFIGAFMLIAFCYCFFISFSSGVPAFFDKRPALKYKGSTLLVFRSLSTKLASMGITLGTIALIFTATLISEGTGLLFQNQFNQTQTQTTNFDLFMASTVSNPDFGPYEEIIAEDVEVESELRYTLYNADNDKFTQFAMKRADYWSYYDKDQLMRYSDYAKLREMSGYPAVPLEQGTYILHCMEYITPIMAEYPDDLLVGGRALRLGSAQNEGFTQLAWDGNGRGFLLVVPDEVVEGQTPSRDSWAMMTKEPVGGAVYQKLTDVRDGRFYRDEDNYETLYARGALREEYASMSAMIVFPLFYLALVLIMVAATILTVQFLSDAAKYRRQYAILDDLGMDRRDIRRALNRQFALFYSMPLLPPIIISITFLFALGSAMDPGIILNAGHLWSIIGVSLLLFFVIYLLYIAAAANSLKRSVLPK